MTKTLGSIDLLTGSATVTPGFMATAIFAGTQGLLPTAILNPNVISEPILQAITSNRTVMRKPAIVPLLPLFRGTLPTRLFDFIVGRVFNVYTSMDHFTGGTAVPTPSDTKSTH